MKLDTRLTAAAAALCCLTNLAALLPASAAETALKDSGINYTESVDYDLGSCDSGYTSCPWIRTAPGKDWSTVISRYSLLLIGIGAYSSGMNEDGTDYEFDEIFFTSLENTLQSARMNGATVGIRFRYDDNGTSNPEPADFDMVLRHIEQIGESGLLTEYEDVISFVETGFVGCWGEQWGGKYTSLEHKAQVLDAFLNITPETIPVTIRTPNTFRQWLSDYCGITTTAEDMSYTISDPALAAKAARVGLYNDGYMGSDSDLGTYSNRAGETAWLHNAPSYGGEFSGNDEWRMKYTTWQPEYALPEMYYTNLLRINSNLYKTKTATSNYATETEAQARLDEITALYEACGLGGYDYGGSVTAKDDGTYDASWNWLGYDAFTFDAALDAKLSVDCDNSAFYGQTVWQFIRAHLGYRFVLRESLLTEESAPGEALEMQFTIENTGFSETPKDKEVEVLLTNGSIVYTYTTDLNARDWASATTNDEALSLTLPETMPGGEWDVLLRISERNDDAVYDTAFCTKFANADLQYDKSLGANYMGSLTVDAPEDMDRAPAEDEKPAGYYMDAQPIAIDETNTVTLLDKTYTFEEDGHYGFTFLYKAEGITEELQLGNWYAGFTVAEGSYGSAYTTYGLNTRNQVLTEDGYYALHIPFYGCAFNCTEASVGGTTQLTALTFNDSRNYWSEDTFTSLGGNSGVTITPIAFIEGGHAGYDVTFHLESGDYQYTGTYGFEDKLSQSISNVPAVTVLSLLEEECPAQCTDESGNVYKLLGFTTREGDKSAIIREDCIAMGTMALYPFYELDRAKTNLNATSAVLTNGADSQGVRYLLDETTMTATVGDAGAWENNSGFAANGSIILPAQVISNGKTYAVTAIGDNAFGSNYLVTDVTIPGTVQAIGENAFYDGTELYVYKNSKPDVLLQDSEYTVHYLYSTVLEGDVNRDSTVDVLDIIALNQWLLGMDITIDGTAGDLDASGTLTVFDLALLKRMLL